MSARIDGEDDPGERAAVDRHLGGCPACRQWWDDAVAVTRLARTGVVGVPAGVDEEVLATAQRPRRRRLDRPLRALLGTLGAVQLMLGLAQVTGFTATHVHSVGGDPNHLWHESAAWNVAVGAGYAWIALRRSRPSGLMPTLTAFVAMLTLLSVNDVVTGLVDTARLLSHGFLIAGYVLLAALNRGGLGDPGEPPAERRSDGRSRWRVSFDDEPAPALRPALRLLPGLPADRAIGRHPAPADRPVRHRAA